VFYNSSAFDGRSGQANEHDDAAIATDKQALAPGQAASFANYTSYSHGINGVMVDVAGAWAELTAEDFEFKVGREGDPATWANPPVPAVSVRPGAGASGADRVTLTWPDGAIENSWLQVTVKITERTGLQSPDVFFFGNLVGDADGGAAVTASDLLAVRRGRSAAAAPVTSSLDVNRDGRVNVLDEMIVRRSVSQTLPMFPPPDSLQVAVSAAPLRLAARRRADYPL
jgi:hypothetical protein